MKRYLKLILPLSLRKFIRRLMKYARYNIRYLQVRRAARTGKSMRIIVGAAETYQAGWFSTNQQWLDITSKADWDNIFPKKGCVTHIVAEHVFEHLTAGQAATALKFIYDVLQDKGRLRIAVPDGFHPDPEYIRHVGINGLGADASDHKQLLNKVSLDALLVNAGFNTEFIEGYSENGELNTSHYDTNDGFVLRSRQTPQRITAEGWNFKDAQSSLIMDGIKTG